MVPKVTNVNQSLRSIVSFSDNALKHLICRDFGDFFFFLLSRSSVSFEYTSVRVLGFEHYPIRSPSSNVCGACPVYK